MSRLSKSVIVLAMLWAHAACSGRESTTTTQRYPATRKVDVVDNYFGTKVADPYRWLEKLDSPEVREWAAIVDEVFGCVGVEEAEQVEREPQVVDDRRTTEQRGAPQRDAEAAGDDIVGALAVGQNELVAQTPGQGQCIALVRALHSRGHVVQSSRRRQPVDDL